MKRIRITVIAKDGCDAVKTTESILQHAEVHPGDTAGADGGALPLALGRLRNGDKPAGLDPAYR